MWYVISPFVQRYKYISVPLYEGISYSLVAPEYSLVLLLN